ncbi:Signal transduction histidine kinase [Pseudonocardia ammonioxydans]|uniref:histidine kinase n=1 Tax=Pseudonocardia ammonioxydans TaxID=260086 RepID=A0A1I4WF47_PSUAM|nr:histidine kinase [Pseudonocardia ammonioxydans]SFN11599.1 Signal transduction histidine kinase [Pseudonocardia ammonioxydans]
MPAYPPPADLALPDRPDRASAWLDRRMTAVGLTGPLGRDIALAVVVALLTVGLMVLLVSVPAQPRFADLLPPTGALTAAMFALVVLQSLLLGLRRTTPRVCLVLVAALQAVLALLLPLEAVLRGPATAVAAYTCATLLPGRRTVQVVASAALIETAGLLVAATRSGSTAVETTGQIVSGVAVLVAAAFVGAGVATRRRYVELIRVRAAEVIAAQRDRAAAALGRERTRMARELHDIAAHHLSGMVVQAGVVEQLVDRDPERARSTAAALRRQGRRTLRDLRMVVGTLRDPGDESRASSGSHSSHGSRPDDDLPVPGLAELDRLVTEVRGLGTPVELVRHGPVVTPAPIADVTCYRVVQEALANARDHAPGAPVRVTLTGTPGRVVVEIANPAAEAPVPAGVTARGYGLIGMRERAQLVGAEFAAGPTADGGWLVRLAVPVEPDTTGTEDVA